VPGATIAAAQDVLQQAFRRVGLAAGVQDGRFVTADWGAPLDSSTTMPLAPMSMVSRVSVGGDSTGACLGAGAGALSLFFLKNGRATEYASVERS